eukprot:CAMPEP_0115008812 /NCGR_PEP_ID=MMETSP0216-20121206/22174_1 /TAXON_ID=223996 /ORGANISM="Protocruzia adherens, Strain Boccale" /LENGTH=360 /DNA_ID=CAMNT_0002376369 /DNA_START=28 /DNA_END=1110 /DNA_ORIENTATION=+
MANKEIELPQSGTSPSDYQSPPSLQGSSQPHKRTERQDSFWLAIIFQLLSSLCVVVTFTCVKISNTTNHIPNAQIMVIRSSVTTIASLALAKFYGVSFSVTREESKALSARATFGLINIACQTYGIQHLNLAVSTTLLNTGPIFGVVFGVLFLGEKFSRIQVAALGSTFMGVVLIAMPCLLLLMPCDGNQAWNFYLCLPLLAGIARACTRVTVRTCKNLHWVIPVFFGGFPVVVVVGTYMLIFGAYTSLDLKAFLTIVMSGVAGTASHIFMVRATQVSEIGLSMPLSYISVILMFFVDTVIFDFDARANQILGAVIIFFGILCLAYAKYRQSLAKKKKTQEASKTQADQILNYTPVAIRD